MFHPPDYYHRSHLFLYVLSLTFSLKGQYSRPGSLLRLYLILFTSVCLSFSVETRFDFTKKKGEVHFPSFLMSPILLPETSDLLITTSINIDMSELCNLRIPSCSLNFGNHVQKNRQYSLLYYQRWSVLIPS